MTTPSVSDERLRELIKRFLGAPNGVYLVGNDGDIKLSHLHEAVIGLQEALESRSRIAELEKDAKVLTAILFDHGIIAEKVDGGWKYEYDDNSALSPKPCEWSKTVCDAQRYRWLRDTTGWHEGKLHKIITLHANALWDEAIDAAIDAARKEGT